MFSIESIARNVHQSDGPMIRTTAKPRHIPGFVASLIALTVFLTPALADGVFEQKVAETRVVCDGDTSTRCAQTVHQFLDSNGDGLISLGEVEATRITATTSVQDLKSTLTAEERTLFGLALVGIKSAGAPAVFANFDTDGSGMLDITELFADVTLDSRSFAVVASDPNAVDWPSLANRFGKLGQALLAMHQARRGR